MTKPLWLPAGLLAALFCAASDAADSVSLSRFDINPTINLTTNNSSKTKAVNETALIQRLVQSLGNEAQLKPIAQRVKTKAKGLKHQRYQQYVEGVPVWGQQLVVHSNQLGQVKKLNGTMAKNIGPLSAKHSADEAFAQAVELTAKKLNISSAQLRASLTQHQNETTKYVFVDESKQAKLVWYVSFFYQTGNNKIAKPAFIIDANDNTVLQQWEALRHAQATGPGGNEKTGQYQYGSDKPHLEVSKVDDHCVMENDKVKTVNLNHGYSGTAGFAFDCGQNDYKAINGGFSPLNDVHFNATKTVDMYQDWYGQKVMDEPMLFAVHYASDYSNSFYNGDFFAFGDGGTYFYPSSSLGIVSHEVAHAFTDKRSGLHNRAQSGAIGESFADIAAEATEYFVNGSNDWLVGAQITKSIEALRYFADPTKHGLSIDHVNDYHKDNSNHTNAGVFNKAFYLLANSSGWDVRKAFDVFVDANDHYWTSYPDFTSAGCGVMNAAHDRNYSMTDVALAFEQVGVLCNNYPLVDNDADGMDDVWESRFGLNPNNPDDAQLDVDDDGLSNLEEYQHNTLPNDADSDDDSLADGVEINIHGTNPTNGDSDNDGLPDDWEILYGFDPLTDNIYRADSDDDGFTDLDEFNAGTSPKNDSDKPTLISQFIDSFEGAQLGESWVNGPDDSAGWQVSTEDASRGQQSLIVKSSADGKTAILELNGFFDSGRLYFDFISAAKFGNLLDFSIDGEFHYETAGGDGLWHTLDHYLGRGQHVLRWYFHQGEQASKNHIDNVRFFANGLDQDNDGRPAQWEYDNFLDDSNSNDGDIDSDGDGLSDALEYLHNSDPNNPDTDGDGISDGDEINVYNTDPRHNDSDRDGMPDNWELEYGLNPSKQDGYRDTDQDGVIDSEEYLAGTDPHDANSSPEVITRVFEDFDSNTMPSYLVTPSGADGPWLLTDSNSVSGDYSLGTTVVEEEQKVIIEWSGYFGKGQISFDLNLYFRRFASFEFYVDGQGYWHNSSEEWFRKNVSVPVGFHTLRWEYTNYQSSNQDDNRAWIDNLLFLADGLDSDQDGLTDQWEYDNGLDYDDPADAALDFDNDGLTNIEEFAAGTSTNSSDTDGDGLSDFAEINEHLTNPLKADSDGDKLPDNWELGYGLDPLQRNYGDFDGDGFDDYQEYLAGSSPVDHLSIPQSQSADFVHVTFEDNTLPTFLTTPDDSQGQWLPTDSQSTKGNYSLGTSKIETGETVVVQWSGDFAKGIVAFDYKLSAVNNNLLRFSIDDRVEMFQSGSKNWQSALWFNVDQGTHTLRWEYLKRYDQSFDDDTAWLDNLIFISNEHDGDGDELPDAWEFTHGLDFYNSADAAEDLDSDGLSNLEEYLADSDITNPDSDGDGLTDGAEVKEHGTNPNRPDSDGDGLPDGWEVDNGLDPSNSNKYDDTDGDGISDVNEYRAGSHPNDADSIPELVERLVETFESNVLPTFMTIGENADVGWITTDSQSQSGTYSLTNAPLKNRQSARVQWQAFFKGGKLWFDYKRRSPKDYRADLIVNSGYYSLSADTTEWTRMRVDISEGINTLAWSYYRSEQYGIGSDNEFIWIDNLVYIADGQDNDNDEMPDQWEYDSGLDFDDPNDATLDLDGDGLSNIQEFAHGTYAYLADSDDDGINDGLEVNQYGTDPLNQDSDNDGMPDNWEVSHGLDPIQHSANGDSDGDGVSDLDEYLATTLPNDAASLPGIIVRRYTDFEQGIIPPWLTTPQEAHGAWIVAESEFAKGKYSLQSSQMDNNDDTVILQWQGYFNQGQLNFDFIANPSNFSGWVDFSVDGQKDYLHVNDNDWHRKTVDIEAGFHTLRWQYRKSGITTDTQPAAWLDNIVFITRDMDGDKDGIPDQWEYDNGMDFADKADGGYDWDNDGLDNFTEYQLQSDLRNPDSDGDGLSDGDEVYIYRSKLNDTDSDGDGMPDAWEVLYGLDPADYSDGYTDSDGDGISNRDEYKSGTVPNDAQSVPDIFGTVYESFDSPVMPDYLTTPDESVGSWQPSDAQSHSGSHSLGTGLVYHKEKTIVQWQGYFADGVLNFDAKVNGQSGDYGRLYIDGGSSEYFSQTDWGREKAGIYEGFHTLRWVITQDSDNPQIPAQGWIDNLAFIPYNSDSDNDGIKDQWEHDNGLDFTNALDAAEDADEDGLSNLGEYEANSDINNPDTDDDGLSDGEEVHTYNTNPRRSDSDSDGMPDSWEVSFGLDPNNRSGDNDSDEDGVSDSQEYKAGTSPIDANSTPLVITSFMETFESTQLPAFLSIPQHSDGLWTITDSDSESGDYSLTNSRIEAAEKAIIRLEGIFERGRLYFDSKLDVRQGNRLLLNIDDGGRSDSYDDPQWTRHWRTVYEGFHSYEWIYDKRQMNGPYSDKVWLDNLVYIPDYQDADEDGMRDQWEHENRLDFTDAADADADRDNDGLSNLAEYQANSDLDNPDTDGDGLSDGDEVNTYGSNPKRTDSDYDGMPDAWEVAHGLDPTTRSRDDDADNDGVSNYEEYLAGTNPTDSTSTPLITQRLFETFESNSVPTYLETPDESSAGWTISDSHSQSGEFSLASGKVQYNETSTVQWSVYLPKGTISFDHKTDIGQDSYFTFKINGNAQFYIDGSNDWQRREYSLNGGTYTFSWNYDKRNDSGQVSDRIWIDNLLYVADEYDGDEDGMADLWEYNHGLDFTNAGDAAGDLDNDGLTNLAEFEAGSAADNADTDNDGLTDGVEVNQHGTDPLKDDTDNDDIPDSWEVDNGLDPLSSNRYSDSDEDGVRDYQEYLAGTDPNDSSSTPVLVERLTEYFDSGNVAEFLTTPDDADAPWIMTDQQSYSGNYSLTTTTVAEQQKVVVELSGYFKSGKINFKLKLDTRYENKLRFSRSGGSSSDYYGKTGWQQYSQNVNDGFYTLRWEYDKQLENGGYQGQVWLDDLVYIANRFDGDNDGIEDQWEYDNGLDFTDGDDAALDYDNDGLSNLEEFKLRTDIRNPDTDSDGLNDGAERNEHGTDPLEWDSDNDEMPDGWEVNYQLDATRRTGSNDHDNDGLSDYEEYLGDSDPADPQVIRTDIQRLVETFENSRYSPRWYQPYWYRKQWQVSSEDSAGGDHSLSSGLLQKDHRALIEINSRFVKGWLNFDYKVLGDASDRLRVNLSNRSVVNQSGASDWRRHKVSVDEGQQRLSIDFEKGSSIEVDSAAFIDNVIFIAQGADNDQDGMMDQWELDNGLDFNDGNDAGLDHDNDGMSNLAEYLAGTQADHNDSDFDGIPDGYETDSGLDPLDASDGPADSDGDGLTNLQEYNNGTNPHAADTDGDGVSDSVDAFPLDPDESADNDNDGIGNNADTDHDNDGMSNEFEAQYGLNPNYAGDAHKDLDKDGVSNLWEYRLGSDPTDKSDANKDTDGDGFGNLEELKRGSNPLNKRSVPTTIDAWIGIIFDKKNREAADKVGAAPVGNKVSNLPPEGF